MTVVMLMSAALSATACPRTVGVDRTDRFLADAWSAYKQRYLRADGYVLDPSRGNGEVTSEGQGYTLLRAAWMRDAQTFDRVLAWTEQHLKRADGLHSWRWTPDNGGHLIDPNTASDADQEIAFALALGATAFGRPALLDRARELLLAIRHYASIPLPLGWFPAAGNWAVSDRIVNLSYFVPYAHPYFARIDPDGNWDTVTDAGYDLIAKVLSIPGVRLVPDFLHVDEEGEAALLPHDVTLSRDFGSDGMRLFWRTAFDCRLHGGTRACADHLGAHWLTMMLSRDGRLYTRYALDGSPVERTESVSFYATALPFLEIHSPATARPLRAERLSDDTLKDVMRRRDRYYDANWVWFGMALADGWLVRRTPAPD
jgi:endoglucanase